MFPPSGQNVNGPVLTGGRPRQPRPLPCAGVAVRIRGGRSLRRRIRSLWVFSAFEAFACFLFCFFFFSRRGCFVFLQLVLKRQPRQDSGQPRQERGNAPGTGGPGGAVAAAAQFEQTPAEIQVPGFFLQLLPQVGGAVLAVSERRGGASVEVIPVPAGHRTASVRTLQPLKYGER